MLLGMTGFGTFGKLSTRCREAGGEGQLPSISFFVSEQKSAICFQGVLFWRIFSVRSPWTVLTGFSRKRHFETLIGLVASSRRFEELCRLRTMSEKVLDKSMRYQKNAKGVWQWEPAYVSRKLDKRNICIFPKSRLLHVKAESLALNFQSAEWESYLPIATV